MYITNNKYLFSYRRGRGLFGKLELRWAMRRMAERDLALLSTSLSVARSASRCTILNVGAKGVSFPV